jgi:hypothetical protein
LTGYVRKLVAKQKERIKILVENEPSLLEENEYSLPMEEYGAKMRHEWHKSVDQLRARTEQAYRKYDEMLEELAGGSD